eukprot:TRINITY_DN19674_c0_g1_i1.p2 TRINITY_DN19674_c0_g1~~TRINITY_DN19674_c0_g1_i1.p2  ORF type:complete len:119 (-),score=5.40 TRINITY_DN19674_c0_g1_i1:323-679(-)
MSHDLGDAISREVFLALLDHLYAGTETVDPDMAVELLDASSRLLVPSMRQLCESLLSDGAELANVAFLWTVADRYDVARLRNRCEMLIADALQLQETTLLTESECYYALPEHLRIPGV